MFAWNVLKITILIWKFSLKAQINQKKNLFKSIYNGISPTTDH